MRTLCANPANESFDSHGGIWFFQAKIASVSLLRFSPVDQLVRVPLGAAVEAAAAAATAATSAWASTTPAAAETAADVSNREDSSAVLVAAAALALAAAATCALVGGARADGIGSLGNGGRPTFPFPLFSISVQAWASD